MTPRFPLYFMVVEQNGGYWRGIVEDLNGGGILLQVQADSEEEAYREIEHGWRKRELSANGLNRSR
jgi:hypothetical protein